jgi:hypothetical protein
VAYLAFDTYSYPGDAEMAWMWAHGFTICGLYLNHARGGQDQTWIPQAPNLAGAGWGLIPLYLGWQTVDNQQHHLPPPSDPNGTAQTDAAEAVALMQAAKLPVGTAIYFDIEDGTVPSGDYQTYLLGWAAAIAAAGYTPAVYCSHNCAAWAGANNFPAWSFHLPFMGGPALDPANLPTDAIDPGCLGTQIRQNVSVQGLPLKIDFSRFSIPNPSCPSGVTQAIS